MCRMTQSPHLSIFTTLEFTPVVFVQHSLARAVLFGLYDTDKDGRLSHAEIFEFWSQAPGGSGMSPAVLQDTVQSLIKVLLCLPSFPGICFQLMVHCSIRYHATCSFSLNSLDLMVSEWTVGRQGGERLGGRGEREARAY